MDTLRGKFGSPEWDDASDADEYGVDGQDDGMEVEAPPSPVGQDERRMQVRAYNFWASLLHDRSLPNIEDLDPETMDDFGPYSVLLDFTSGIENPAVPYLGDRLAGECSAEQPIETLADVPSRSLLSRITDHYMQILANKAPIGFEAEFVNQTGATILYRGILLPFSTDDDTIDFIYGVINWKEVADQITTDALLREIDRALEDGDDAEEDLPDRDRSSDPVGDWADGPASADAGREASGIEAEQVESDAHPGVSDLPMPEFGRGADAGKSDAMAARLLGPAEEADEDGDDPDDWSTPLSSLIKSPGRKKPIGSLLPDPVDGDVEETDGSGGGLSTGYASEEIDEAAEHDAAHTAGEDRLSDADALSTLDLDAFEELHEGYNATDEQPRVDSSVGFDRVAIDLPQDEGAVGLYDCLAAARELAQAARSCEDRSRNALYAAVGRAYDVSLAAEEAPEDFAELVAENGLSVQDRAPMTPVVKLVFGADYDKTRLTEYAAVLSHAHRMELERGSLGDYLSQAEGGLKGVVQAERRMRREESGKPVDADGEVRASLAKKLRRLGTAPLDSISPEGEEFVVALVRRMPTGEIVLVGDVQDDVKLVEQVGRKLVA